MALIDVEPLSEFRKLPLGTPLVIPESRDNRKCTDIPWLIFFVFFILLWIILVTIVIFYYSGDVRRFTKGYDRCGNICGMKNPRIAQIRCSGQDMTDRPFLWNHECVVYCNQNTTLEMNRCFNISRATLTPGDASLSDVVRDIVRDLIASAPYIVLLCLIGLVVNILMLFLYRRCMTFVVYASLIATFIFMLTMVCLIWTLYASVEDGRQKSFLLLMGILFTISFFMTCCFGCCILDYIPPTIILLKEAVALVFVTPIILIEPLLAVISTVILYGIIMAITVLLLNSGDLYANNKDDYEYKPNSLIIFTLVCNSIALFMMDAYIKGCQHLVIAGTISTCYFTRSRIVDSCPLATSFYNLVRYHLGTVACGSFILTVAHIISTSIRYLERRFCRCMCFSILLDHLQQLLSYVTKNAYIQTAMNGRPFIKSGVRAARLLIKNLLKTLLINTIGNNIITSTKIFIVLITVLIGVGIRIVTGYEHFWAGICIAALFTAVIADMLFGVIEDAIDTMFMCYCEDIEMNDGQDRPFYISPEFAESVKRARVLSRKREDEFRMEYEERQRAREARRWS